MFKPRFLKEEGKKEMEEENESLRQQEHSLKSNMFKSLSSAATHVAHHTHKYIY